MLSIQKYIFEQSILLFVVLLFGISVVFMQFALPAFWIVIDFTVVYLFFFSFYRFSNRWMNLSEKIIRKRIFWSALWIRVGYVLLSYLFFMEMTGLPFEFQSADAMGYHYQGLRIAEFFRMGQFDITPLIYFEKMSSRGIMILMGAVYTIFFDSVVAFRILNSILGAWACVMIFDMARRSFGLRAARVCAAMAVPAPPLIYYCGLHLKEAVIIFLMVFYMNIADRLLKEKQFSVRNLAMLVGTTALMFLFRNALAVALFLSFITALILIPKSETSPPKRFAVAAFLVFSLVLLSMADLETEAQKETMYYVAQKASNLEDHMRLYAQRGNVFATKAKRAVFAPLGFIGPLPTLVDTGQKNIIMLAGAMFFRNIFAFFVFISLYYMVKRKQWRHHIFFITVFFSWLFILSNSGYALQDRFHLVFVPIIILFSGYGISLAEKKSIANFRLYLMFLGGLIFAWNWFKLAGRGWI